MNQTMVITQTAAELIVETKLIQPGNERTVKDSYVLDGKEYDFTPQVPRANQHLKGSGQRLDAERERTSDNQRGD
jgi:hypothetical protein